MASEERCVMCGEIIPEGSWVCPRCSAYDKPPDLNYVVKKETGGQFYVAYRTGTTGIPGSYGDKKHALRFAARMEDMPLKEYLRLRRKEWYEANERYDPRKPDKSQRE